MSFSEMGFHIAKQVLGDSIPDKELRTIVSETLSFEAPLVKLADTAYVLELFHGPTLAFKDFGARFMARVMRYLTKDEDQPLRVLVATSGDTGGAVASAFHKVEGTEVIILYPKGGVSDLQEKQLTTLGANITAIEVDGSFDDCQRMVKAAFMDRELSERLNLTSANSINISRLVPQAFYYFEAVRQLDQSEDITFVIPSGNFGNLTAGLLANKLGLPVRHFVAATNINDVVPRYLAEGDYQPQASVPTVSNAMDVGSPSNFARMKDIFSDDWEAMRVSISGVSFDDEETLKEVKSVYEDTGYIMCPHTAVASLAESMWNEAMPSTTNIILSTAHPSKFLPTMEQEIGKDSVAVPERLASLADKPKQAINMDSDDNALKQLLNSLSLQAS